MIITDKLEKRRRVGVRRLYHIYSDSLILSLFRKRLKPGISELSEYEIFNSANLFLKRVLNRVEIPALVIEEYAQLQKDLLQRYKETKLTYPYNYSVEAGAEFFLYCFVRLLKPEKVVETGVANGHSSFYLLNAIKNNGGGGVLHSIDLDVDVGCLLHEDEKRVWFLHVMKQPSKRKLEEILNQIGNADIFIHDSNHSYYWQQIEYEGALLILHGKGFLVADDADSSYAFIDFCKQRNMVPTLLWDTVHEQDMLASLKFSQNFS